MNNGNRMAEADRRLARVLLIIALIALVTGIILRIASFGWNDRLQGDVNLFALTAREFVFHKRLLV